jgi:hypothetical protein
MLADLPAADVWTNEAEAFINARRELDPGGTFLNDHLRELFA